MLLTLKNLVIIEKMKLRNYSNIIHINKLSYGIRKNARISLTLKLGTINLKLCERYKMIT